MNPRTCIKPSLITLAHQTPGPLLHLHVCLCVEVHICQFCLVVTLKTSQLHFSPGEEIVIIAQIQMLSFFSISGTSVFFVHVRLREFLEALMSLSRNKSSLSSGFQMCMWCRLRPIKHRNASGLFQHHPSISLSLLKTKSSRITHSSQMVSKHSRKLDVISHSLVRCLWCMVDVVCSRTI